MMLNGSLGIKTNVNQLQIEAFCTGAQLAGRREIEIN